MGISADSHGFDQAFKMVVLAALLEASPVGSQDHADFGGLLAYVRAEAEAKASQGPGS
jgi:hypothetical protein